MRDLERERWGFGVSDFDQQSVKLRPSISAKLCGVAGEGLLQPIVTTLAVHNK